MTIKEISEKITGLLGGTLEEKDERFHIILKEPNQRIWVHQKWDDQKRIIFSGSFDNGLSQFLPYGDAREKTDISVSVEKSPESMVKSIQSRLLPPYFRMYDFCSKHKLEHDKQETEKLNTLNLLSEYFPDPTIRNNELMWYGGGIKGSAQITYHSQDDVSIKLSCNLETIKKILEVLKEIEPETDQVKNNNEEDLREVI